MAEIPAPSPAPTIPVGTGYTYRERATGRIWTLVGRRSGRRVALVHSPGGSEQQLRDFLPICELEAGYEFLACDHTGYCCGLHGTHTTPHRGCILR